MITAIIIAGSLILAAAFIGAWLWLPGLRGQLEQPKHWFQDQVRQYDRLCQEQQAREEARSDEAR